MEDEIKEIKDKTIEALKELTKRTGCEKCGRLDIDVPTLTLTPTCLAKLCLPCSRKYETLVDVKEFRLNIEFIDAAIKIGSLTMQGVQLQNAKQFTESVNTTLEEKHKLINKIHEFSMEWLEGENE